MDAPSKLERVISKTFSDVCIFILPKRIPKARIQTLYSIAGKRGMRTQKEQCDEVTHVVTAFESMEKVEQVITVRNHQEVVTVDWLTGCFAENKVLRATDRFQVKREKYSLEETSNERFPCKASGLYSPENGKYECMKAVTLHYKNQDVVRALEVLEKDAQFKGDDARALAFRRASCAIKSFEKDIKDVNDVSVLTYVGKHACRVIQDILETGESSEVEDILQSEKYQVFKAFNGIYGCGPATAKAWYNQGFKTLQDIRQAASSGDISLTNKQEKGIQYYEDLNEPVTRDECSKILQLIQKEMTLIQPEASVELVGGQRRGKFSGHDVDVFICPKHDKETTSVIERLIERLEVLDLLLFIETQIGFNTPEVVDSLQPDVAGENEDKPTRRRSQLDHLDKAFMIMKCPQTIESLSRSSEDEITDAKRRRVVPDELFKARRVDIIVTPPSQYAVALLGWTGSKHFNRSLRLFAWREKKITISNHAIWDHSKQPPSRVQVSNEGEIFEYLGLLYLSPEERNH